MNMKEDATKFACCCESFYQTDECSSRFVLEVKHGLHN